MALGHRAALVTVGAFAVATTAATVLVIAQLPDAASAPVVELRPAQTERIETGSLPRAALYPETEPSISRFEPSIARSEPKSVFDPTILDEPPPPSERLRFVPPGALDEYSAVQSPPVDAAEAEATQAWSTQTRAAAPKRIETAALPTDPRAPSVAATSQPRRPQSLQQRLNEISPAASERIEEKFKAAKVAWPPAEIALVAIKDKRSLELYARPSSGPWTFVHRYPVLAASGGIGPKLTRGDKQVPEGVYRISYLNPNSRYHVSMRVNYPNSFDRRMAAKDKRRDLGGDIMIHGKRSSAGCLAMGDAAAEELFVMAAEVGVRNIKVVIAPTDFRTAGVPASRPGQPEWLPRLYFEVASELAQFKPPPPDNSGSLLSLLGL